MPYSSTRSARPRIAVLHTGEGILDRFDMVRFLDNNSGASAHAASDAGGFQAPLVAYDRAAWTAGPTANNIGLHIEMCAFAQMTRDQWLSESDVSIWIQWLNNGAGAWRTIRSPASMLRWTAAWVRSVAGTYGIPIVKLTTAQVRAGQSGICGHADTSAAFGETDHTDPGGSFPWDVFISLVAQEDDMPLTPNDGNVRWAAKDPIGGGVETHEIATWMGLSAFYGLYATRDLAAVKGMLAAVIANQQDDLSESDVLQRLDAKVGKEFDQLRADLEAARAADRAATEAAVREVLGEDNAAQADAIMNEWDRRARDNNPDTGPRT